MSRRKRAGGGVSFGTILMLTLMALVLIGFCAVVPKFTGNADIRINAAELAVAVDQSLSQIAASNIVISLPQNTPLPAESVAITTDAPAAQSTQAVQTATPQPSYRFSLRAAGSLILNTDMYSALTYDGAYRFDTLFDSALVSALQSDLTIATLESLVMPSAGVSNRNAPAELLSAMRAAGINALSIGYPNVLRSGVSGVSETKAAISAAGLTPYGAYASQQERETLTYVNAGGVTVALLAYQSTLSSASREATTEAERAYATLTPEIETIAADIARARAAGAMVVLVSLCWGDTGATSPSSEQVELAQAMADAGADIILGTHPGVLQTVEVLSANRGDGKYHPVLCAYSLGNLVTYDREKRANLASILLNAEVVYDAATGQVAFDELSYTPTYAWRGWEDGYRRYRILVNDGVNYPAYVGEDQQGVMERCLTLVTSVMEASPIPSGV